MGIGETEEISLYPSDNEFEVDELYTVVSSNR